MLRRSILSSTQTIVLNAGQISSVTKPLVRPLMHARFGTGREFSTGACTGPRYSEDHEWINVENDIGTIGISDHAQHELGDVVFVDLPSVGQTYKKGSTFCAIESVKAASDVFAPISCKVLDVNQGLKDTPALINQAPEGRGWIARVEIADGSEVNKLMNKAKYEEFLKEEGH